MENINLILGDLFSSSTLKKVRRVSRVLLLSEILRKFYLLLTYYLAISSFFS